MDDSTPARSDSADVKSPPEALPHESASPDGPARSGSVRSAHLNQRSCVTCRRRKVRCDKLHPSCTNCTKASIECVFPGPGRAKRKTRKPQDAELLARLKKLEGVIQSLGAQGEDDKGAGVAKGPAVMPSIQGELEAHQRQETLQNGNNELQPLRSDSMDKQLGRLVINEGRSRYVSNAFWASMGDEVSYCGNQGIRKKKLTFYRWQKCETSLTRHHQRTTMTSRPPTSLHQAQLQVTRGLFLAIRPR